MQMAENLEEAKKKQAHYEYPAMTKTQGNFKLTVGGGKKGHVDHAQARHLLHSAPQRAYPDFLSCPWQIEREEYALAGGQRAIMGGVAICLLTWLLMLPQ